MTNYTKLLKKYEKPTKSEKTSKTYNKRMKLEQNRKNRHLILDSLLNEIPFHLTKDQEKQIRYWIDNFNNYWKQFHRQSSDETILLALIMIQRKDTNPKLKVDKFSISRKYNLTNPKFEIIQNRLIFMLMKTTPLTYNQSVHYNHEILIKQGR